MSTALAAEAAEADVTASGVFTWQARRGYYYVNTSRLVVVSVRRHRRRRRRSLTRTIFLGHRPETKAVVTRCSSSIQ